LQGTPDVVREGREQRLGAMHSDYRSSIMRQLRDQQVRYAPRERKLEQVENAERLMGEVVPEKAYPYEYVCFR
jgi:hypothetical protein